MEVYDNIPLFKKGQPERYTVDQAIEIITKHSLGPLNAPVNL